MVDFKKRLGSKSIAKKVNPIEIYDELDRKSETGPLRPVQKEILTEWWQNRRDDKDLVLKLHTGQGKTLIGLLMLQSKLNENKGPCLYVCPNDYLVEQTCQEADKFGIGYVTFGKDNYLPDEFINSEKILITYVQKVFNGKSIFGIGGKYEKVSTIILDDSHACIEDISECFKIKLNNKHELYKKLLNLFEEDLREQGGGSFLEIKDGEYNTFLPVPYWSWQENKTEVTQALLEYVSDNNIKFAWNLIKDNVENCQCFVSGQRLEISPFVSLIHKFGTFSKAEHRILMSATTQNDSFFIKGLGLNINAVKNPLFSNNEKWSGEKMILIPSLINEHLERVAIINRFAKPQPSHTVGVVAITPSYKKSYMYEQLGSIIAGSKNIIEEINKLKSNIFSNTIVLVNKYDGIDLPDNCCRILIIDSMPYAESLTEQYEEYCREDGELSKIRVAQKIEQGIGRSVRGEKDYSVILIIGHDLVKFLNSVNSSKFFSEQTRKQINIGKDVADYAKEDLEEGKAPLNVVINLINQCLKRDEGWKEFYKEKMDEDISNESNNYNNFIEILELERKAEDSFYKNEPENAVKYIQKIVDSYCNNNESEKGWYLQCLARYKYKISKVESNRTQKSAHKCNTHLLKPKDGINYKRLQYINENRLKRIKDWISSFESYEELLMEINDILEKLTFGQPSDKFEKALQDLGNAIGFLSQRPDKEFKKGPDNLWCIANGKYLIFECKSEVEDSRNEITKSETGQMNNHCGWFEQEYKTAEVTRILIIPTKDVSNQANFTHDVKIMKKGKLKNLRDNVKSFFKEFKDYDIKDINDSTMHQWLLQHKLDINSIPKEYVEEYYQKK
ncbi:MAG: DEAD/DEAH box helicase family protein [Nostocales cyanobacterium 94392]|nr:DEAD/DEAH box helicase family protein [Nostocales cyanobacterium 94392]